MARKGLLEVLKVLLSGLNYNVDTGSQQRRTSLPYMLPWSSRDPSYMIKKSVFSFTYLCFVSMMARNDP
jgi:hypothetical protein